MTEAEKEQELLAAQAKRFAMTEEDDLLADVDADHVHVHGCCSCHSNIGK